MNKFTQSFTDEEKRNQDIGLNTTLNYLAQAFGDHNDSMTLNTNQNQNQMQQQNTSNFGNISGINPRQNQQNQNQNRDQMLFNQLQQSVKLMTKLNENILKIPTLTIAKKLNDKILIQQLNDYENVTKKIFNLNKIEYKTKLYLSAYFVPKHERQRISFIQAKITEKTEYNFNYIMDVLNTTKNMTINNYGHGLNKIRNELNHFLQLREMNMKSLENKVSEKRKRLNVNDEKWKFQTVKSAIYNNYNAEVNKLYQLKFEMDEYYETELIKYKYKTILSFNKLTTKIGIKINENKDINYDFSNDLNDALRTKHENKSKIFNDKYKLENNNELRAEPKYEWIDGIKMNEEIFDAKKCVFDQLYHVNMDYHQRKLIVNNFGNTHDKYSLFLQNKSNQKQRNYNKKKNYQNKHYYKNRKYQKYSNQDF